MIIPSFATKMKELMPTRGIYKNGWPKGAIVHFTAGHDGARNTILGGIKDGYTYWCIQRDGSLFCAHSANEWGYHAGKSAWPEVSGGVSDELLGIEMNAAGKLSPIKDRPGKYISWFKKEYDESEVRYSEGKDNQERGYYHIYTPEQEKTLIKTLLWLKSKNPDVFDFDFVLGHDSVAPSRKNDPGAALSMTIPEFQMFLKGEYEKQTYKGVF